jgi:hypothetical protein
MEHRTTENRLGVHLPADAQDGYRHLNYKTMNERTLYQQLTELENIWETCIAGWEHCARLATKAGDDDLSLRNSIRARTTQHCLDELRKVTKP